MANLYADTLAIATGGDWVEDRIQIISELTVTVTAEVSFIVTVEIGAS